MFDSKDIHTARSGATRDGGYLGSLSNRIMRTSEDSSAMQTYNDFVYS